MRRRHAEDLDADPMLTSEEVAVLFRVDPKTVNHWAEGGLMGAIKTPGGGKWLFRTSEVRKHLKGGVS
jgi:excisionase family DNA binding protein